jgi:hypothetical protein
MGKTQCYPLPDEQQILWQTCLDLCYTDIHTEYIPDGDEDPLARAVLIPRGAILESWQPLSNGWYYEVTFLNWPEYNGLVLPTDFVEPFDF